MKQYPRKGEPGFYQEYWFLLQQPKTEQDCYRQLHALAELDQPRDDFSPDWAPHYSKRRKRIIRQYWALRRRRTQRTDT